jgi:uncharacterized protein YijF (DUF1287 family)
VLLLAGSSLGLAQTHAQATEPGSTASEIVPSRLPALARQQVGVTLSYDPAYRVIAYPNGDVEPSTGVCSDVIIRALRLQGLDLQQAVHLDMGRSFSVYPRLWGLKSTDRSIDHRRVPNLEVWMTRQGWKVPGTGPHENRSYLPGDIVTWNLGRGLTHIGFVSDRLVSQTTRPLVIHNIGAGTREEDILFQYSIRGQFRHRTVVSRPANPSPQTARPRNPRQSQRPARSRP